MESSKVTAKHIKQMTSEPQAAQIHLMHHQCTESPLSKFQRKQKKHFKSRQGKSKQHYYNEEKQRVHKKYEAHTSPDRCKNAVIHNMLRDLDVQVVNTNAEIVINMVI